MPHLSTDIVHPSLLSVLYRYRIKIRIRITLFYNEVLKLQKLAVSYLSMK